MLVAVLFVGHAGLSEALQSLIQTELILGVAWLLGDAVADPPAVHGGTRGAGAAEEREREERTRRAIVEERERIARELHDIVTHHVSVIVIQAGGGSRAIDRRPDEARTAFDVIARTGRQALSDMRRMLGILGERERAGNDPMPGLDSLDALLDEVRAAGLPVELAVHGEARPLDPGLELSAYRIIQEGLTNSLKYARGGHAQVTVQYGPAGLDIAIDDERGPGAAPTVEAAHEGRGLVGMRERVAMFRGTFAAQPTPTGFRVTAHLPVDEAVAGVMSIRVLLVDDQELVRTGFRMILADEDGIEVVGEAANGREAVDSAARLRPDVIVMDIRMPVMDGVEATRQLAGGDAGSGPRVLVLTTFDGDEHVLEALRAGASGSS